jgi:hypothetical protein
MPAVRRLVGAGLFACSAALALPSAALASHPAVEEGKRRYDDADFRGALESFSRAEAATDLTRGDLIELYVRRALVFHAMNRREDMEMDLFRLATLEPRFTLPRAAPPAVRRAFQEVAARVSGPVRVEAEASRVPGGIRIEGRVADDLAAIVQAIRVYGRVAGQPWRSSDRGTLEVPGPAGATVEYYVEAIGPGGAAVASAGSASTPLSTRGAAADLTEPRDGGAERVATGGGTVDAGGRARGSAASSSGDETVGEGGSALPWILVGGGVAVAATVVVVLLVTGGQTSDTQLGPPMIRF